MSQQKQLLQADQPRNQQQQRQQHMQQQPSLRHNYFPPPTSSPPALNNNNYTYAAPFYASHHQAPHLQYEPPPPDPPPLATTTASVRSGLTTTSISQINLQSANNNNQYILLDTQDNGCNSPYASQAQHHSIEFYNQYLPTDPLYQNPSHSPDNSTHPLQQQPQDLYYQTQQHQLHYHYHHQLQEQQQQQQQSQLTDQLILSSQLEDSYSQLPQHLTNYYNHQYQYQQHLSALQQQRQLRHQQQQLQIKPMSAQSQQSETTTSKSSPKLIWLLFMHRHGDRAPLNMAPRDKYNNITYWPEGFGNLNNAGRQRMYKVGKYIRRRYDGFLSDNIREIYSRSSDVDRCIESSHALLAGLYPPTDRYDWNKHLHWIPAPVHTVPAPEDYLLNEAGRKFLLELIQEIQIIQNSEAVKKLYEESVKERELLEREMGYEYDMFYKFKCTYSTLDIEERSGLALPTWYTPELKQKLYRYAGIAFGLAGGGTEKLKKIRCGHLLDDIVSRMEMASIDGPKLRDQSDFQQPTNAPSEIDQRKVVHYSTHDSIIAAFLESLNINSPNPVPPGFGATFFIELYVDLNEQGLPTSEKYIKLFYMDDTESESPIEKMLPNAELNEKGQLTLNNFKKFVAHLLPSNQNSNISIM